MDADSPDTFCTDDDGDFVTFTSDEELVEALGSMTGDMFKVHVHRELLDNVSLRLILMYILQQVLSPRNLKRISTAKHRSSSGAGGVPLTLAGVDFMAMAVRFGMLACMAMAMVMAFINLVGANASLDVKGGANSAVKRRRNKGLRNEISLKRRNLTTRGRVDVII